MYKRQSQPISDNLAVNPQVKLYDPLLRGYMLHEVSEKIWTTTAKAMRSVLSDNSDAFIRAKFEVTHGVKGFKEITE